MHSFSYTFSTQFSPYFPCRVSWLPIITNLGSLSQISLNEYQLKSISFNYNICGIWKIFNNTRQRKYGLIICITWVLVIIHGPVKLVSFFQSILIGRSVLDHLDHRSIWAIAITWCLSIHKISCFWISPLQLMGKF